MNHDSPAKSFPATISAKMQFRKSANTDCSEHVSQTTVFAMDDRQRASLSRTNEWNKTNHQIETSKLQYTFDLISFNFCFGVRFHVIFLLSTVIHGNIFECVVFNCFVVLRPQAHLSNPNVGANQRQATYKPFGAILIYIVFFSLVRVLKLCLKAEKAHTLIQCTIHQWKLLICLCEWTEKANQVIVRMVCNF